MAEQPQFSVELRLLDGYKFEIDFGEAGQLFSDETPPLGEGTGPNPSRLLAAAVANCLAASLLFAVTTVSAADKTVTNKLYSEKGEAGQQVVGHDRGQRDRDDERGED